MLQPAQDVKITYVPLGALEKTFVWTVWLFFAIIPFNHVRTLSKYYFNELFSGHFEEGLTWLGGAKDVSNSEWTQIWSWCTYFVVVCSGHSLLLRILIAINQQRFFKQASIIFTTMALCFVLSSADLLILFGHIFISFLVITVKSKQIIWIWVLLVIFSIIIYNSKILWVQYRLDDPSTDILPATILLCCLRVLSFGVEFCSQIHTYDEGKRKPECSKRFLPEKSCGIIDFLCYILYLPLFFSGPVLTYEKFIFNNERLPRFGFNMLYILKEAGIVMFYGVSVEVAYHICYSSSISTSPWVLEKLNCIQTASIMWVELNFFCMKYMVLYRAPSVFLMLDGLESPGQPRCISTIFSFRDMWRDFDKGLYAFLKRYIYVPIGGSKYGLLTKIFASFCCFTFVALWHGGSWNFHVPWGITNWLGMCLETFVIATLMPIYNTMQDYPKLQRRAIAFFGTINIILLIFSNMIFLNGFHSTKIYFRRLFLNGFPYCPIALIAVLYCAAQCIIDCSMKK